MPPEDGGVQEDAMRKITILLLIVSMTVLLAGCGSGGSAESETTLEFKKNGQVVHTIVEDFSADYYDLDELETDVKSQIEEYNTRVGSDRISLDSSELEDGTLTMVMTFQGAEDYSSFYRQALFCGTVKAAFEAGYDLDIELNSVQEEGTTINKQDILDMGERHIIVVREAIHLKPCADILYASGDVEVTGDRDAVVTDGQSLSYIIFR